MSVAAPANSPSPTAIAWYAPSEIPTASVQASGISRPTMWPPSTARIPMWNSGLAIRMSLRS